MSNLRSPCNPPAIPLRSPFDPVAKTSIAPCPSGTPLKGVPDGSRTGDRAVSAGLVELARRINRLRPSHRDPEAFHAEKSEIAATLRRIARER